MGEQGQEFGQAQLELEGRVEARTQELSQATQEVQRLVAERQALEARLRKSEASYHSFVEHSAEGIWRLEMMPPIPIALAEDQQIDLFYERAVFTECNQAMAKMYGLASAEEFLSLPITTLMVPTDEHNIEYLRSFIRSDYRLTDAESHELDAQGNSKFFLNNLIGERDGDFIIGAWGTQRDITETRRVNDAWRASTEHYKALLSTFPDWIFRLHRNGTYLDFQGQNEDNLLRPSAEFIGKTFYDILPAEVASQLAQGIKRLLATKETQSFEYSLSLQDALRQYEARLASSGNDEVIMIVRDITREKQAQTMEAGQQQILEMIARGASADAVLEALVSFIEAASIGAMCSVRLLGADKKTLQNKVAPHLPPAFVQAINGLPVVEGAGVCGTAAYRKAMVIVADIMTDSLCVAFRELAAQHHIRACWSVPIVSKKAEVLGTFAMYYREPREPAPYEVKLLELSSRLAGIVIERHLAEQQLRESEERFSKAFQYAPLALGIVSLRSRRYLYANDSMLSDLGYSEEEIVGRRSEEIGFWAVADEQSRLNNALEQNLSLRDFEIRVKKKGGALNYVLLSTEPLRIGDEPCLLIVANGITERVKAEQALRESEARFHNLAKGSPIGIYRTDLEGRYLYINERWCELSGFSQEQGLDYGWLKSVHPDDQQRLLTISRTATAQQTPVQLEQRLLRPDGTILWAYNHAVPEKNEQGETIGYIGTITDISERKHMEEALRLSEAKFRAIAETSPVAIMIYRRDAFVYVNPAVSKLTGYSSEELLQMQPFDLIHPDYRDIADERWEARFRGEKVSRQYEYKSLTKSGDEQWVEFTPGDFIIYEGEHLATGTFFDITDRKHAEEMLANEKERLSVTVRSIGDGVIATDIHGNISLLNKAAETLTGWRQEEAVGKALSEIFHTISEKTRERLPDPSVKILHTGRGMELDPDTILIARDGSERVITASAMPIYDRASKLIGGVLAFRDKTEERQREEELLKASKLESIGLLAGGIAHDFNNILTAILGNVSLAKIMIESSSKAHQRLEETEQATLRAKDLTQQLLTFARGGAPVKHTASLVKLLHDGVNFALTGSNIECQVVIQDNLWLTEIDEGQINQVIHNLVLNARQAMPIGGRIDVCAENLALNRGETLQGIRPSVNSFVKITVADQGVGIPEEYLKKIFDPYFTTKQKGSGLGLATAYSIMKNHDGYLFVESRPGEGTTFMLYLPASEESELPEIHTSQASLSGKGKILVMDDEQMLREMIRDMLDYLGYSCEAAKTGEEAIEMYQAARAAGAPFDAVIVDLTVPGGMGGQEAVNQLRQLDPQVKGIVSSGYSNDPIMAEYRDHGFVAVIAKPYQISQLGEILHTVLGHTPETH